jgi:hypothetical protein
MSVLRIRINMFLASRRLIHKSEVWILLPSYKNSSKNFDFYYMYFVTLFDFSSLTWILNTDLWCSIVHVFWTAFFFPPPPPPPRPPPKTNFGTHVLEAWGAAGVIFVLVHCSKKLWNTFRVRCLCGEAADWITHVVVFAILKWNPVVRIF